MRDASITLIAIVGPTASGKTALSVELAAALGGEIVSADSRQIYRGMDIGTAKATRAERERIPHHLLDVVAPDQVLTLAQYQAAAYGAIEDIARRGRRPLLAGGTGQYVAAVLEGWQIPEVAPQEALRGELEAYAAEHGPEALHGRLAEVDPAAAAAIDFRNVRRVIRALEVSLVTGRPISELQRKSGPPYTIMQLGVTRPRPELYERIDRRVDRMIEAGLVDEVRGLAAAGYDWDLPAMTGLGYRQIGQHLRGEATLDEVVALIKRDTRRFVRQQYNWFRTGDESIRSIDPSQTSLADVLDFLNQRLQS